MAGVALGFSEGETAVLERDGSNLAQIAAVLERRIQENPWVAVQSLHRQDHARDLMWWDLFRAAEVVVNDGIITVRGAQGERSFAGARLEQSADRLTYTVHAEVIPSAGIAPVQGYFVPFESAGTGGTEPPTRWTERRSEGQLAVLVGKQAETLCPDATTAVQFVERAVQFHLPLTYSMPGYLLHENGLSDTQQSTRGSDLSAMVTLDAVRRLLGQTRPGHHNTLSIQQVGSLTGNAAEYFRKQGYLVVDTDLIIGRGIAFAKVGKGLRYGDAYILPGKGFAERVEQAFTPEAVNRLYPAR